MKTVFLRVLDAADKAAALRAAICNMTGIQLKQRYEIDPESFAAVPRSPFAYWVRESLRESFGRFPSFESNGWVARVGIQTSDDFRFLRLWWEHPPEMTDQRWYPFAKGGQFSPFYADLHLVVNWAASGAELKAWAGSLYNNSHWSRILKNTDFFFAPGVTWPARTQGGLSMRAMPMKSAFGHKGPAGFKLNANNEELLAMLAMTNSAVFRALVDLQMAFGSFEVGVLQRTPVPQITPSEQCDLARLARCAWLAKRRIDTHIETSHAFTLPAVLQMHGDSLAVRIAAWRECVAQIERELIQIQELIDDRCFTIYGLEELDRCTILEQLGSPAVSFDQHSHGEGELGEESEADDEHVADSSGLAEELVAWAVGAALGRFDVRMGTGDRKAPPDPEPFDPLPVSSPGMLTGHDQFPPEGTHRDYPLPSIDSGMLVDDPGHPLDLFAAVRRVFDVIFNERADAFWQETAELLDSTGHDLRGWLAKNFFEFHLRRYGRSRRKAPIYWQLATTSGSYSVWLYAHRLTRDSLFRVQKELVARKLEHEERQLANLVHTSGNNPTVSQRREREAIESLVAELRTMHDELERVAALWKPELDDGIVLTMSPLWRLVPQHRAWQRELKGKWDELCAGKYDWAHTAMRLWPERVISKCQNDRSLAIAHGLEAMMWVEDEEGKWKPRAEPATPLKQLIRERTSDAIKDALKNLLESPTPSGKSTNRKTATKSSRKQKDNQEGLF